MKNSKKACVVSQPAQIRRHDVDWLRLIAFFVLIFYHVGMFYVDDWNWHVKSQYQSSILRYPMILVNQWRMPLIFFISGFALSNVESKIPSLVLLKVRFIRLFVPLLIGMYVIVAPQVYYEAVQSSQLSMSYWSFYLEYINPEASILANMHHSPLGLLTWGHLWYLAYLWFYTLIYLLIKPIMVGVGGKIEMLRPSILWVFLGPVILMTIFGLALKPIFPKTHALTDDWYNHSIYFSVFCFGYFAAKSERLWQYIGFLRRRWLFGAIISYFGVILISQTTWFTLSSDVSKILFQFWVYTNVWCWLLAVVGFASVHLNKPCAALNYMNQAILPWYIIHQTIIIVIAAKLAAYHLGGFWESTALIITTFILCAFCFEVARRFWVGRVVLGMKWS